MNSVSSNTLDVLQNQMKTSGYNNSAKSKESKKESKVTEFEKAFQKVSEPLKKKTNSLQDKMVVKEELSENVEKIEENGSEDILAVLLNLFSTMGKDVSVEELVNNFEGVDSSDLNLLKVLLKNTDELLGKLDENTLMKDSNPLKEILLKFIAADSKDKTENLNANKLITDLIGALPKLETSLKNEMINDNSKSELYKEFSNLLIAKKDIKDSTLKDKVSLEIRPEAKAIAKEEKLIIKNENNKNNSNGNLKSELSSEEKILEKLIGDKEDGKLAKVNQFMNVFNSSKASLEGIKSVDKLLVNKATFSEDIVKSIRFMQVNNIKDLTVKINPKHLGEVIINLTMDQENMKAQLKAVNKDTIALLNANLKDITEKLNENIKIQQVEVSIYNDDTTYFSSNERENSQGFNREQNKSKVVNVSEEAELGKENTAIDDSSLNMLI